MSTYFDEDDRDAPLEQDVDADDEANEILPCPSCGQEVFEDAERCPYCGDWITPGSAGGRLHWVWMIAGVLALAAFITVSVL